MRLLDVYDQQLAVHGQVISMRRRQFVEWLQPVAASCYCAIADDAEQRVIRPIADLCRQMNVPLTEVPTMAELGDAAGIDVGAAVVTILAE